MRVKSWIRRTGQIHLAVLAGFSILALRDHLPIVPNPREDRKGFSWRPVLFGLGAAVGFAVAIGRARKVEAPGMSTATPTVGEGSIPGRVESAIGRSIHLPSPLKNTIEAELSTDGPLLFSPPDAIDPIGTDVVEQAPDSEAGPETPAEGTANRESGAP